MIRAMIYRLGFFTIATASLAFVGCSTVPPDADGEVHATPPADRDPGEFHLIPEREWFDPAIPDDVQFFLVNTDDYDTAYHTALDTLRDAGFRIARDDPRFGVITTYPKDAPTIFEPWVGDNSTYTQARDATLNDLRRVVTIELRHNDLFAGVAGELDLDAAEFGESMYGLTVQVAVERRQEPTRYLTHSARGSIIANYHEAPARLAQRALDATYWEPIGSDNHLAKRLLDTIRQHIPGPEAAE